MIDEEETYRRFGYCSGDLSPGSHKKITAVCDKCGKVREVEKRQYHTLCFLCSQRTEEYRKKHSDMAKGNKNLRGKHLSRECRQKMSAARKGKTYKVIYGVEKALKIKEKRREAAKQLWQNEEYITRWMTATRAKPNTLENKTRRILLHLIPDEFAYNGDFSQGISIGRRIPDFVDVNGHKWIIELFGEPFHSPLCIPKRKILPRRRYSETIKHYKKYGYKCIIFWSRDIDRPDAEAFVKRELKKVGWLK